MLHEQRKQSKNAVVFTSTQKVERLQHPVHSAAPEWTGLGFGSDKVLKEETGRRLDADKQYFFAAEL